MLSDYLFGACLVPVWHFFPFDNLQASNDKVRVIALITRYEVTAWWPMDKDD